MDRNKGLQSRDIYRKIDEFNSNNKLFAKLIIIRESLAEQMAELIQYKQEEKKDALGDIYLDVIYGKSTFANCTVYVSSIADLAEDGILIG